MSAEQTQIEVHKAETGCVVSCAGTETRCWYAWDNIEPPPPNSFHVTGEVYVSNPGVEVLLVPMSPQGINPSILLMELVLIQRPGVWPSVMMWKTARYDLTYGSGKSGYEEVNVFCGDEIIADLKVETAN